MVSNIILCQLSCSDKGSRAGITKHWATLLHFLPLERLPLLCSAFPGLPFQRISPWCSSFILTLLMMKDSLPRDLRDLEVLSKFNLCKFSNWQRFLETERNLSNGWIITLMDSECINLIAFIVVYKPMLEGTLKIPGPKFYSPFTTMNANLSASWRA